MKITHYGAAECVTGSCHMVECNNKKFLVDCGMFQGTKSLRERNYGDFLFNPAEIDFVLLTHAHIDHSGLIPKLFKYGFKGNILTTPATVDLCEIMLPDSGHIQEVEVERKNRKNQRLGRDLIEPIYTENDAYNCLSSFKRVDYDNILEISDNIKICFRNAGHILGSAVIELYIKEENNKTKVVFSGDLGNKNQPIIEDPYIIDEADYLILESTYGNRTHSVQDRKSKREILGKEINAALKRGGNIIVPAFAVERTQDILVDINILIQENKIPEFPIYLDSPMAINATQVFQKNHQYFDKLTKELNLDGNKAIELPNLKYTRTVAESTELNKLDGGAMIISASGMCEAGRIKHHLKHNIWKPNATILFVGYQAEGTLGRRLVDGEKIVRIHGDSYSVKASIVVLDGFSGHADNPGLVSWVSSIKKKPKKVILVHGEPESLEGLKESLNKNFEFEIFIPKWLDSFNIKPVEKVEYVSKDEERKDLSIKHEDYFKYYKNIKQNMKELIKLRQNSSDSESLIEDLDLIEKFTRKFLR